VTTLVATISNDFVRRLPVAQEPCGTNAKNRPRDRRLTRVVQILTEIVERSASVDIIRVARRDRDGGEQTALKKKKVLLRIVHVWGVNLTLFCFVLLN